MIYLLLVTCGALSGFLAGLLGIGGGFVVVPILQLLLPRLGVDPALVPVVAVATSLAAMVPTAASAVFAQHRRRALRAEWVRLLAPGVALGSAVGSLGAASIGGAWITLCFAVYAAAFSLKLLLQRAPAAADFPAVPTRAGRLVLALPQWSVGLFIGGFASLAGVGGASLVMSYLMSRRAELHQATAATSAVGLVIALVGATGFGAAGFGVPGFTAAPAVLANPPSGLVGFVFWPAAAAIGAAAIVLAPIGVAAAHRLPVCTLRQSFAVLLLALAAVALTRVVL